MNAHADRWTADWSNAVFSLAERDSRWAKIRRLMARDGIDVILCLPCTNNHDRGAASIRYLSQMGENSDASTVAFPIEGEIVVWQMRGGAWPGSSWFSEIRAGARGAAGATVTAWLKDNPRYQKSVIGIAGLDSGLLAHVREGEGEVNWQSVEILKKNWPQAQFVSATRLIGEARWQKSAEEIEFLRKGTEIAEVTLKAVAEATRAGVRERHVFAKLMYAHADAGGSFPPMVGWSSGPLGNVYHRVEQPSFRTLNRGDILTLEIDGRWGGYISQIDQSIMIGPAPQDLRDAWKMAIEAFDRVCDKMRPGTTVRELIEAGKVTGMNGRAHTALIMHGRGTGDDGPLLVPSPNRSDELLNLEIAEGCSFVVKPFTILDGINDYTRFGESVVVTAQGTKRLGTRPKTLIVRD
jgi:Xaa-Pro dipeptidase